MTSTRHIAFLRAINTPPRHVKMERLVRVFEELGFEDVSTFIASGNVLFSAETPDQAVIEEALVAELGFAVPVYLRTAAEVRAVAEQSPFGEGGGSLHISFLAAQPSPEAVAELLASEAAADQVAVIGREVYWQHQASVGESEHSEARLAKILGMATTRRSANTVRRIAERLALQHGVQRRRGGSVR